MATVDIQVIGLTVQLLGILFIAISILIKKPRKIVEEVFGLVSIGRVRAMRHTVYKKNQLLLGIFFLLVGYTLQIFGLAPGTTGAASQAAAPIHLPMGSAEPGDTWTFLTVFGAVLGAVLALSLILNIVVFLWTKMSFRRLISDFLKEHDFSFEENIQLTKEIGELVGVPKKNDSSIEEYVADLKESLKLVANS